MIQYIKKLFSKKKKNIYKNRIAVHVPENLSDFVHGRGNLITVCVTDDVYMPYLYHDEVGVYEGIAEDCRGCDVFKKGDVVKFHMKGVGMPVAEIDF